MRPAAAGLPDAAPGHALHLAVDGAVAPPPRHRAELPAERLGVGAAGGGRLPAPPVRRRPRRPHAAHRQVRGGARDLQVRSGGGQRV